MIDQTREPRRPDPYEVLFRIKRGLSGYVSYLAASEMNESFTEYLLYEPILRILLACEYKVECEFKVERQPDITSGDFPRIDFVAKKGSGDFALEVKWPTEKRKIDVSSELYKFQKFKQGYPDGRCFICLFGVESVISNHKLYIDDDMFNDRFSLSEEYIVAKFIRTKFGCKIFELDASEEARSRTPSTESEIASI